MKRVFRFSVKIKGTNQIFAEGLESGEIYRQDIEYKNLNNDGSDKVGLAVDIQRRKQEMLDELLEVTVTECS